MTKTLFDKLVKLCDGEARCEAVYRHHLRQAGVVHAARRALEARLFILLNLSEWVQGRW